MLLWGCGIKLNADIGNGAVNFNKPNIFMSNHQSHFDIPSIFVAFPSLVRFLTKKEIRRIPFLGWSMRVAGFVFIDRTNREEAFKSLEAAAKNFIEKGHSIVIFPEGTRSSDGVMGPFKKGGFHLALQAGTPIVPVGVWGTINVIPKGSFLIRPGRSVVKVGAPIHTAAYDAENLEKLMRDVRAAIAALVEECRREYGKQI
jgi:1-acyl-sn-glycerol-3-phosphate acyltransferase